MQLRRSPSNRWEMSSRHCTKTPLVPGARDVLLYTGFNGTVGALIPFISREDVDFFQVSRSDQQTNQPLDDFCFCGADARDAHAGRSQVDRGSRTHLLPRMYVLLSSEA